MATVTTTPIQANPNDVGGILGVALSPFKFLLDHIMGLLFFSLTVGIVVVIFIFYYMNSEEKKEQEDMSYKEYKNTIRTINKNTDETMYVNKWSKWNLIFLGLPLIRPKYGRKVYNKRSKFIGYYDGMFNDMLGNTNIMLWKDKTLGIIKNKFVIRIPSKAYFIREESTIPKNSKGKNNTSYVNENGVKLSISWVELPEKLLIYNQGDKTFKIKMINTYKSDYYYYPVFEDDKGKTLDLTESINSMNQINNSNLLLSEVIKQAGKNVVSMAKVNTQLVYEQRQPEKVKEVEQDE